MSKWEPVDPKDIKVGDKVKVVACRAVPTQIAGAKGRIERDGDDLVLRDSETWRIGLCPDCKWYRRKPKKVKQRPAEPPPWTFFRVDRTGEKYQRYGGRYVERYVETDRYSGSFRWDEITQPGDTITMLTLQPEPQTVTTEAEYEALPVGSVVLARGAAPWSKRSDELWYLLRSLNGYANCELAGRTRTVLRHGWGE